MSRTFINGDEVEYSGETVELHGGLFYVTHRVSDGRELLTQRSPEGRNPMTEEKKAEWQEQQAEFRRLRALQAGETGYFSPNLNRWISFI